MELRKRRKLLVASVGVATITYAVAQSACSSKSTTGLSGDDSGDGAPPTSGNLPSPPDDGAIVDFDGFATSGNLALPPPMDAGVLEDAGLRDADASPPADAGADGDAGLPHDSGTSDP